MSDLRGDRLDETFSWRAGDHLLRVRGALLGGAPGDALGYGRAKLLVGHSTGSASLPVPVDLSAMLEQTAGLASEYTQLTLFSCEAMLRGTVRAVEYAWGATKRSSWGLCTNRAFLLALAAYAGRVRAQGAHRSLCAGAGVVAGTPNAAAHATDQHRTDPPGS